jgi:hypothetical protein
MIIQEHKTIKSIAGEEHHYITVSYYGKSWKILISENIIQKMVSIYLWEQSGWRKFLNNTKHEAMLYQHITSGEIVKLKYKVQ